MNYSNSNTFPNHISDLTLPSRRKRTVDEAFNISNHVSKKRAIEPVSKEQPPELVSTSSSTDSGTDSDSDVEIFSTSLSSLVDAAMDSYDGK